MMNILVLMAGRGQRFKDAGYELPKPLIDVCGIPMIQRVIENLLPLPEKSHFIFMVLKEHQDQYDVEKSLRSIIADHHKVSVILVDKVTEGAACTALLAKDLIDNNDPLLIVNSDQLVEWPHNSINDFLNLINYGDGAIVVFEANDPKWSYVKTSKFYNGCIVKVAEKQVISNLATAGLYLFKYGKEFIRATMNMIRKNIRTNNEFYLAPCYNQLISEYPDPRKDSDIFTYKVNHIHGLGTPEDLKVYMDIILG